MKRMSVALAVVGMLMVAASAFAQAPAAPALSTEQAAQIQKIQAERLAEMGKFKTEMSAKQVELQALFREPNLDRTKIEAKQKELASLQGQMVEKEHAYRLSMAEVLTPEQRAQLPAFGGRMPFGGPRGGKGGMGFRW
jgi:hypothetical protein